jgi:predicted RNA-binding protein with EMAP domain
MINKIKEIIKNLQEQDAKDYHDGIINGLSEDSVRAFLTVLEELDLPKLNETQEGSK